MPPPDDVRITKPAETIPVAEIAPAVAAPVVVAEAVPIAAAPAAEIPVEAAPAAVVAEELPTAQPTLFELAEQRQAEKAKPAEVAADAEKPAAEGEKPVEEKAAEAKAEEPKAEGEKPAEIKAEEKPAEVPKVEPVVVAPAPIEFTYALPENVTLPEKEAGELHGALSAFATNPGDKDAQQKLVDFHFDRLRESITEYNKLAHKSFADTRAGWQKQVMEHPEIGGGNHDGAMQAIAYVRDNFLSSHPRGSKQYEAAKKGLDEWMHLTGAGDNPHFLELMHNVSVALNEPQMQGTQEIRPIVPQENGGRASIYRHPTSNIRR